jgi:diguanylate cyclase (GGDEF)-like protein
MTLSRPSRSTAFVLGLTLLLLVVVAVIAFSLNRDQQRSALKEAEGQAVSFVNGAEAAINSNLLGVDVLLASTDQLLGLSGKMREWIDSPSANALMQNAMRQNLLIGRVTLLDAQGQTIASSEPPSMADSSRVPLTFIQHVLNQPISTLVISSPETSFRSSEPLLHMGRHIRLADGSAVAVIADVTVSQLRTILTQGANIAGLQATIERGDGELLVESPANGQLAGRLLKPPLNALAPWDQPRELAARLDNKPAIVVARNMLYGGIFVTASIPLDFALKDWNREASLITAIAIALGIVILIAGVFSIWYLSQLHLAQETTKKAQETLTQALGSMVTGFVLLDPSQQILTWNRRFLELHPWLDGRLSTGIPFRTAVEETAVASMPNATALERHEWVEKRMALLKGPFEARHQVAPDGTNLEIIERPTPEGGTVIVYQDVTRLHRAIADVELLAFYDPLTGLPNRRLLNDRLQQGIISSLRTGRHGALLFLDLDHFKTLNDTAGHDTGDVLLQQVAQRLKTCVREEDTVARLGGDEFVIMLQSLSTSAEEAALQAQKVGETILSSLNKPYLLNGSEYNSSCSLGATLFGKAHQDAADLLKQADIAMYQVKNTGRNALCFFDPNMLATITARAETERALRQALDLKQLVLHFQIQVAAHGRPVGAEVLIRWQHPERGMVPPGQFIGLAEETGLILPIGEWVLRMACQQLKRWETHPLASVLQLAVNVSARQFRAPDFVQMVSRIVLETGIQPKLLKLELTESMVLDSINDTIATMQQLKALGVRFSIDDFGTGYSSLAYLTRLPLDQLKIDQSFVRNIGQQASDSAVIDTIIGLARSLGLEVIAEGVETIEQREFLAHHGCERCQGYLFGKPVPIMEFEAALASA